MVYNDYVRAYIVLIEASTQYLYTASIYECLRTITNWNDFKKIGIWLLESLNKPLCPHEYI